MESRSILNLLKVVLDNIDKLDLGLCFLIENLETDGLITSDEYFILSDYLFESRPVWTNSIGYWWPPGVVETRVTWLNLHIKILEKNQS